jgi:hypothetical protein
MWTGQDTLLAVYAAVAIAALGLLVAGLKLHSVVGMRA